MLTLRRNIATKRAVSAAAVLFWLGAGPFAWGQYNLQGTAVAIGGDCYRITADTTDENGTIWSTSTINTAVSFTIEFSLNFGTEDLYGADGMVFVLQQLGNKALAVGGQGMGYKGFMPALGIEFDTYKNRDENDPDYDHIAFVRNGSLNHANNNNLAGPVQASAGSLNIEDGKNHLVRIRWDTRLQVLEVYFDCELRLRAPVDMEAIFGQQPRVFWGFTAATGDYSNNQVVCIREDPVSQDTLRICRGEEARLVSRSSPDGTYQWSPSSGLSDATVRTPTARPAQSQLYTVKYQDACGRPVQDSVFVLVDQPFPVDLGKDRTECTEGNSVTLQPASPDPTATYRWTTGETTPAIRVSAAGQYGLTVQRGTCESSGAVRVRFQAPTAPSSPTGPSAICLSDSRPVALRTRAEGQAYVWAHSGETRRNVSVDRTGTYTVRVTNRLGCELTETFEVSDACRQYLWVPDAFSPNADGYNDALLPLFPESGELQFWVYNRWGEVVFFTDQPGGAWDGFHRGVLCPPDLYAWKARYRFPGQSEFFQKWGSVRIVR